MTKTTFTESIITVDLEMQLTINLPVAISKEEADDALVTYIRAIVRGLHVNRAKISEAFDIPYRFVDAHGILDDLKPDSVKVDVYTEPRK